MVNQQTFLVILWYNPKICSIKKCEVLLEENEKISDIISLPKIITLFEQGEWLIMDNNLIIKYSILEEKNQPKTPGYEIYNMHLVTRSV